MKGIKGAAIVGALAVAYLHFAHNIFYAYITRQESHFNAYVKAIRFHFLQILCYLKNNNFFRCYWRRHNCIFI